MSAANKKPVTEFNDLQNLEIEGSNYYTRYTKKFPPDKLWARKDEREVLAFIPGTIQKVMAKPGQKVDEGEPLLVLEAMKMRNVVTSHYQGTIKEVYVKEGDMVPKNFLLIEFE